MSIRDLKITPRKRPSRTAQATYLLQFEEDGDEHHESIFNADELTLLFGLICKTLQIKAKDISVPEPVAEAMARMEKQHAADLLTIKRLHQDLAAYRSDDDIPSGARSEQTQHEFPNGSRVIHPRRGPGCILRSRYKSAARQVLIKFDNTPVPRWFLLNIAGLKYYNDPVTLEHDEARTSEPGSDTLTFDESACATGVDNDGPTVVSTHLHYEMCADSLVTHFMVRSLGTICADAQETPFFADIVVVAKDADGTESEHIHRFLAPEGEELMKQCVQESQAYRTFTSMVKES